MPNPRSPSTHTHTTLSIIRKRRYRARPSRNFRHDVSECLPIFHTGYPRVHAFSWSSCSVSWNLDDPFWCVMSIPSCVMVTIPNVPQRGARSLCYKSAKDRTIDQWRYARVFFPTRPFRIRLIRWDLQILAKKINRMDATRLYPSMHAFISREESLFRPTLTLPHAQGHNVPRVPESWNRMLGEKPVIPHHTPCRVFEELF
jgi:hypothetical protein